MKSWAGGSVELRNCPGKVRVVSETISAEEKPLYSFGAELRPKRTHGRWSGQ
jgi:hypothetical protein